MTKKRFYLMNTGIRIPRYGVKWMSPLEDEQSRYFPLLPPSPHKGPPLNVMLIHNVNFHSAGSLDALPGSPVEENYVEAGEIHGS